MTVDEQQSTSVLRHVWTPEKLSSSRDQVAVESPVALVYNGISHVVMMTTPTDLEDFAYGFSLSEGIACNVSEILDYDEIHSDIGVELHVTLANEAFSKLKQALVSCQTGSLCSSKPEPCMAQLGVMSRGILY